MTRHLLYTLYIAVTVVMAIATVVATCKGQDYAAATIYSAGWFTILWAALAVIAVIWIIRRHMRRWSLLCMHASLLLILAGALLTHLTARKGTIHLRRGVATTEWQCDAAKGGSTPTQLPFALTLTGFNVVYDAGTQTEADYQSAITVTDHGKPEQAAISMNHVLRHRGYWFYQTAYDEDQLGSTLTINADPYGIPVTYAGYILLALSLVGMLADPRGTFRQLLRNDRLRRGLLGVALLATNLTQATAAPSLPKATAERMGRLCVLYNGRICTLQTYAIDFTRKIYGRDSYQGLTAEQVLCGWIFWGDDWSYEKFIRVKDGALSNQLKLADYMSLKGFFTYESSRYILGPYIQQYYDGNHGKLYKQAADVDERIQLIMELLHGSSLRLFPQTVGGTTRWLAPMDALPRGTAAADSLYIRNVFGVLYEYALAGRYADMDRVIDKMAKYQTLHAGTTLPTTTQRQAEALYNRVDVTKILFMACLTLGLVLMVAIVVRMVSGRKTGRLFGVAYALAIVFLLLLTARIALRWLIGGTIPLANGYETMLALAWAILLIATVSARRWHIMLPFGLILGGFFLLVSHIGEMDPNITPTMPVLRSPLLSLHVSVIVLAYALLSISFLCSVTALIVRRQALQSLMLLSQLMLYPAIATLAIGIFIGAVWANVSWGSYWSWDPKEVWALITLMVYAVPMHRGTVKAMARPVVYHIYMVGAFGVLLMTYFGVNYLMTGMHSYY